MIHVHVKKQLATEQELKTIKCVLLIKQFSTKLTFSLWAPGVRAVVFQKMLLCNFVEEDGLYNLAKLNQNRTTRPQLSKSNKYLVMSPRWGSTP
jgi:hypothetical protein